MKMSIKLLCILKNLSECDGHQVVYFGLVGFENYMVPQTQTCGLFSFFFFLLVIFWGVIGTASKQNWQKKLQGMRYESYYRDKATYKAAYFLLPKFSYFLWVAIIKIWSFFI